MNRMFDDLSELMNHISLAAFPRELGPAVGKAAPFACPLCVACVAGSERAREKEKKKEKAYRACERKEERGAWL